MRLAQPLNAQLNEQVSRATANQALAALNQQSKQALANNLLPDKFAETWKYTKLHQLEDGHLTRYSDVASAPDNLPDFGGKPLVIVNGRLPEQLPDWDDVELSALGEQPPLALANTTFALFNGATLQQGLHLTVRQNVQAESVHHIIFYSTGDTPAYHNTRLVIELAPGSKLKLIEHYLGDGAQLCNAVTEVIAHDNSELVHCRLQSEATSSLHISQLAIRQERDSRVKSYQFMRGAHLRRNNVNVRLEGEGAELVMGGAFIAMGKEHVDNQLCVEHCVPHCESQQNYKGIAGQKGRAIFNGRIHILPGASKTNSALSNKNLLLSADAEIDTKPELEIYNDDVKAAHGTTIGQIDPDMHFYLQSRGINDVDALRMLSIGFIKEELSDLPFDNVREWAGDWLGHVVTEGL